MNMKVFDTLGIGFGPANLSLAIALREASASCDWPLKIQFLESKPTFAWHPGMLIEGTTIQVSFLKDLVTLSNPCSHFTFINYLKQVGRLDEFINLQEFFPSRLELNDYFCWAAKHFSELVRSLL